MKKFNRIAIFAFSLLTLSCLSGCATNGTLNHKLKPIEVGGTVKEWKSSKDFFDLPMNVNEETGQGEIVKTIGNEDKSSLYFELNKSGYIGSELTKYKYFTDEDVKNGDIISLYYYLPSDHNIKTIKLEAKTAVNNTSINDDVVNVTEDDVEKWIRLSLCFDTLNTLHSIRLNYTLEDTSEVGKIYIDNIKITLGLETVKTGYTYNNESLCETYEDYFKVGTCMSNNMFKNTEFRKIMKHNFNSVTAENEAKPEQVLDQQECQRLAATNPGAVAIKTTPFEDLYDWAEANHIGVRHHTLVWYSQTPAWFFTKDYSNNGQKASKELMLQRMENLIKKTFETLNDRWPGLVYAVDVANEAVENGGLRTNNNNWYSTVGNDFVYYAFKYASQYKEEWQDLYYNDFAFDYQPTYCNFALENIIKDAINEGLIDGVGLQGHLDSNANMDNIINDAKLIKAKGLKCQITELDITIQGNNKTNLDNQKAAYKNLVKKILENNYSEETDINALIVWGINDNLSWKSNQYPLLFDSNYAKKSAYYGVLEALDEANI